MSHHKYQYAFLKTFLSLTFLFTSAIQSHGFDRHTLIKGDCRREDKDVFWSIEQTKHLVERGKKPIVATYNLHLHQRGRECAKVAGVSTINCHCILAVDEYACRDITCSPTQCFYRIFDMQWVEAYLLKAGDQLLCGDNEYVEVKSITFVNEPLKVYALEVEHTHTFLVGHYGIVTHNMVLPLASIGLGIPFSTGCGAGSMGGLVLGPAGVIGGVAVGALVGYVVNACIRASVVEYELALDAAVIGACIDEDNLSLNDDGINKVKSPGKPTEEDGFIPPKKWEGGKVKNPNGPGFGWPDKKGNIWIPSGVQGHGGPHWDVEKPDGNYDNVLPGGRIRGTNTKWKG